jgi:hypothetical protein
MACARSDHIFLEHCAHFLVDGFLLLGQSSVDSYYNWFVVVRVDTMMMIINQDDSSLPSFFGF